MKHAGGPETGRPPDFTSEPRKPMKAKALLLAGFLCAAALVTSIARAADALPSWNDGKAKQSIVTFVEKVTKSGSPDFVPVAERIATFDNDGCLWAEQPMYFQAFFVFDRIKALALKHPEWKTKEPFASVLKGDVKTALAGGEHALLEMVMATHAGLTTEEFEKAVTDWLATAKHPTTKRPFTEMVYQPMLELLAYLRANGFKTFIVSGGGIEFMRPWTERVYGIPPEQVVGSSGGLKYELRDGRPVIVKLPEIALNDDKEGKPVGIQRHLGRRLADAPIHRRWQWPALLSLRPSHRRGARVGLRPQVAHRQTRQGSGRGESERLDHREHEGRLEDHLPARKEVTKSTGGQTPP